MARKASKGKNTKAVAKRDVLTDKELMFIEQYFICKLNGTEAALAAYDTTDRHVAASIASENLSKPDIRTRVDARLAQFHINADEVLARMAFDARGSMEDFVDPDSGTIDLKKARDAHSLGLLKKYRTKFTTFTSKDGDETETNEIEIELYDGQAARRDLGKHLGLFIDRNVNLNVDLTQLSDEELRRLVEGKK